MSTWHPDGALDAAVMRRCLRELLSRCMTWHSPADAREPFRRCRPGEEQERGREHVLQEVRDMLSVINESWPE